MVKAGLYRVKLRGPFLFSSPRRTSRPDSSNLFNFHEINAIKDSMTSSAFSTLRGLLTATGSQPFRYAGFLLFLVAYTLLAEYFGGLPSLLPAWRMEIPLLLYFYYYCNTIIRPSRWQHLTAAVPIVLIYVIFDTYHVLFGRLLRIIEVTELPEMFLVMPVPNTILLVLAVGLPLWIFLRSGGGGRIPGLCPGGLRKNPETHRLDVGRGQRGLQRPDQHGPLQRGQENKLPGKNQDLPGQQPLSQGF
jgi:hypothetical protein